MPRPVTLRQVTPRAAVLTADNPGPMTLTGTNSYLLAGPSAQSVVVVDPGPDDPAHQRALAAAAGRVELILLTHRHADHSGGVELLHRLTGAPVRAADPSWCRGVGGPLRDGELVERADLRIRVLATPGHTSDSMCFDVAGDGVLTGDTVLGAGTTVIDHPDGSLRAYLDSLRALMALGVRPVLPAHGPQRDDLAALCAQYLAHRELRLDQIRAALAGLGPDATVGQVTDAVYADTDASVRPAAERSVAAQLTYLRG